MSAIDGGVTLLAPGGAYVACARALVVADLHAGYVQTLQRRGYTLPTQGDDALHARLRAMFARADVARVVVAGDLVHGLPALAGRGGARSPLDALLDALDGRALTVVPGNHDRGAHDLLLKRGVEVTPCAEVAGHLVLHGDEDVDRLRGERAPPRAASAGSPCTRSPATTTRATSARANISRSRSWSAPSPCEGSVYPRRWSVWT